jgi:anti-anti-sigma factor
MTEPCEPFEVDVRREQGRTCLALRGELDLSTVGRLEAALGEHAGSGEALVVDLRELAFVDSTGLRALFTVDASADVTFVRGSDHVHRVFEVTGLHERFRFVADPGDLDAPAG